MRLWRYAKNLMVASLITTLYAIWCKEILHEYNTVRMWLILISVGLFIFCLLNAIDRWFYQLTKVRHQKRHLQNIELKGEEE